MIGSGFTCDWTKIGASFLNQLCSVIMQNQLLFDTQVKTALNNEALINNRV